MNPQKQCEEIYYASDVCDKSLTRGCIFTSKYNRNLRIEYSHSSTTTGRLNPGRHRHGFLINEGSKGERCKFPVDTAEIIGHPPKLNDWLRLLMIRNDCYKIKDLDAKGNTFNVNLWHISDGQKNTYVNFNLITGQPATEKDWEQLLEIIK